MSVASRLKQLGNAALFCRSLVQKATEVKIDFMALFSTLGIARSMSDALDFHPDVRNKKDFGTFDVLGAQL